MGEIDMDYHLMVENAEGWTSSDMCRVRSRVFGLAQGFRVDSL